VIETVHATGERDVFAEFDIRRSAHEVIDVDHNIPALDERFECIACITEGSGSRWCDNRRSRHSGSEEDRGQKLYTHGNTLNSISYF
jgi:hypothetical protein